MMRLVRTLSVLTFLSIATTGLNAQSWDVVKGSKEYIWGEGTGATVAEADRNALADLTSKIGVHVMSNFDMVDEEKSDGNRVDSKTYVTNRLNTYSQATLNNTEKFTLKNEPDAIVGRAIKKAEIVRIFESRIAKAKDMVQTAKRAENAGKADDALRNYYWAFALVRSLQHPNEVFFTDDSGQHMLMTWIPEQMNAVFDALRFAVVKREGDDVELEIAYKGRPVTSIDYTFFDGRDWSNIISAKDGRGVLELAAGNQSDAYQLKVEYEYRSEAHIDKEVEQVLGVVRSHAMRKSYVNVPARQAASGQNFASRESFSNTPAALKKAPAAVATNNTSKYVTAMDDVLQAVRTKNPETAKARFTKEGYDIFNRLLFSYGTARIVGTPQPTFYQTDGGNVTARGVQMSFSFRTGVRKSFVEDLVFTFDHAGLVNNVAFGLGRIAEDDILNKGVWSETARKVLMEFLENYKTAYALKRLDYINTIFDDDAVIIVANVAKRAGAVGERGASFANDKLIRYNRYTKDQYLKNLASCFGSNEYINIRFEDNDVKRLGKGGETYAIQISQDYYSSNYGDKGYLFLIVDVNDPKHPLIKVRTWQPEKDPNFGLYGPGDFK